MTHQEPAKKSSYREIAAAVVLLPAMIDLGLSIYLRYFTEYKSGEINPLYKATGHTFMPLLLLSYFIKYYKPPSTSFRRFLLVFLGGPIVILYVISGMYPLFEYFFG